MKPNRRQFLQGSIAAAPMLGAASLAGKALPAPDSVVRKENANPGSSDWQLTRVRLDKAQGFRSPAIEGYCSHQSIMAGETLEIMVSTRPASAFKVEIFRMGWYGGAGARLMGTYGPLQGTMQPDPPVGPMRVRECQWQSSLQLPIPQDWVSGVYLGRLTTLPDEKLKPYWQSYVIFIVRDNRKADILFQCSDNTWQAYNRWPDNYSLYTDPRAAHASGVAVSFDRPYGKYAQIFEAPQSVGSGEFLLWEFPLLYWLEEQGYDVTYGSNVDTISPAHVERCRTFLSVGHDEYWDVRQYDVVKKAMSKGLSALWLCGNSVFGTSPFSASAKGRPNRIITRTGIYGGLTEAELEMERKTFGSEERFRGPDESLIIGARSICPFNGGGDWTCTKPSHWIYEGTGMKEGDSIPGLVGWEHHGAPADISGLEVVAEGEVWRSGITPAHWTATVFPGPGKSVVFNAATIFWPQALSSPPGHMLPWSHWSRPHGVDARVQRITANVLKRALQQS